MSSRSKRSSRLGAAALSLALFASACGSAATDEAAPAGETAESAEGAEQATGGPGLPQLVGNTVSGGQFDTNDLAGQDVVVWFWAPW